MVETGLEKKSSLHFIKVRYFSPLKFDRTDFDAMKKLDSKSNFPLMENYSVNCILHKVHVTRAEVYGVWPPFMLAINIIDLMKHAVMGLICVP